MRRYVAGRDGGDAGDEHFDTREWVFGLLATPRFRKRMEQLERLDLRRRPGCEPCLRALVMDDWTPDALYHMGWCESCRSAAIALGMHAPAAAGGAWYRRRAVWLAVVAAAAIAAPLVGSQVISNGDSKVLARGGSAHAIGTPSAPDSSGAGTTSTPVTPVPRSKPARAVGHARGANASRRVHRALPLTT